MKKIFMKVANGDYMVALGNIVLACGICLWGWLSIKFYNAHPNYWLWCISSLIFIIIGAAGSNILHYKMKKDVKEMEMPFYLYGAPQAIALLGLVLVMWWIKEVNIVFLHSHAIALMEPIHGWSFTITAALAIISLGIFMYKDTH